MNKTFLLVALFFGRLLFGQRDSEFSDGEDVTSTVDLKTCAEDYCSDEYRTCSSDMECQSAYQYMTQLSSASSEEFESSMSSYCAEDTTSGEGTTDGEDGGSARRRFAAIDGETSEGGVATEEPSTGEACNDNADALIECIAATCWNNYDCGYYAQWYGEIAVTTSLHDFQWLCRDCDWDGTFTKILRDAVLEISLSTDCDQYEDDGGEDDGGDDGETDGETDTGGDGETGGDTGGETGGDTGGETDGETGGSARRLLEDATATSYTLNIKVTATFYSEFAYQRISTVFVNMAEQIEAVQADISVEVECSSQDCCIIDDSCTLDYNNCPIDTDGDGIPDDEDTDDDADGIPDDEDTDDDGDGTPDDEEPLPTSGGNTLSVIFVLISSIIIALFTN